MNLDKCPCSGETLQKFLQPAILSVLTQETLHGYKILERLGLLLILRGCRPDATGVYRTLKSMEKRGLVVSDWNPSQVGPAKCLYRLTRVGKECLVRWVETLEGYQQALGELLGVAKQALGNQNRRAHTRSLGKTKTDMMKGTEDAASGKS